VGEIQDDQFLIINSLGKVNGWVGAKDILGRITKIIEPEARPGVPILLEQLEKAYPDLILHEQTNEDDTRRLFAIVDDLRWYAGRIGDERWNIMPRSNKWSFEQNLWHLTRQVSKAEAPVPKRLHTFIDCGKACIGLASEIIAMLKYPDPE
jgi:hypothetical protein